jgi:hypothetical protein
MVDPSEFFTKLESIGESAARLNLAQAAWSEPRKVALAKEWLRLKEESRALEASAKRDAREEETLAIAKSAKASVKYDRYIAIAAIIIAAIAAHKEIMWLIKSAMSWFSK